MVEDALATAELITGYRTMAQADAVKVALSDAPMCGDFATPAHESAAMP
jgi:hypothetical protein